MEKEYLEKLTKIETPKLPGNFNVPGNHQIYYNFCQLRNYAKDLLYYNPNDKETEEKLSTLIIKMLGISLN